MWQTVPEAGNIGWFGRRFATATRQVQPPPTRHDAPDSPPAAARPVAPYASAVAAAFAPRLGAGPL